MLLSLGDLVVGGSTETIDVNHEQRVEILEGKKDERRNDPNPGSIHAVLWLSRSGVGFLPRHYSVPSLPSLTTR